MKIGCHCGEVIVDQTDNLPFKGHLIPDQEWFTNYDSIDDEVIDPLVEGRLDKKAAYRLSRLIISRLSRLVWQCPACGRLYVEGLDNQLRCFLPEGEPFDREVLRSRQNQIAHD